MPGTYWGESDKNDRWNVRLCLHVLLRHCYRQSNIPPNQCWSGVYISIFKNRACEVIIGALPKKANYLNKVE